jgi:MFS family permease
VFPISLGLTSDLVGPDKRQIAIGRTLAGSMTGNLLGASLSGLIGDFLGWRGVLAVLGSLAIVASFAVALGFRGGALTRTSAKVDLSVLRHGYRTIFANPNARVCYAAVFIEGCCVLGLFPYVASFLFEQGVTSLSISGLVIAGFAVGGLFYTMSVSRLRPALAAAGRQLRADGLGLLHDPRLAAGVRQRIVGGSPCHRTFAALVFLFHGPDRGADRLRIRHPQRRQGADPAHQRRHHCRTRPGLRALAASDQAGGCECATLNHPRPR